MPRPTTFLPVNVDLSGKVFVVTGPTSGIGLEIARQLAAMKAEVVLACRSAERGEGVRAALAAQTGNDRLAVMVVDMADQRSIRSFAAEVVRRYPRLDGLVNNAGAWFPDRRLSQDGVELTWATNVLGPFLLTRLLEESLGRARGRVIHVGSHLASGLDLDDVEYARRKYNGFSGAYPQSKQALLMLAHHEARRLAPRGVTLNVAEPEWVRTNAHRHANLVQRFVMNLAGSIAARTPAQGADTAVWLAAAPELAGVTGADFKDRQPQPPRFAADAQAIARLCSLCEAQVGLGRDRGLAAA